MALLETVLLICAAAGPVEVTVTPLGGGPVSGRLLSLSEQQIEVETPSGRQSLEGAALQSVQSAAWTGASSPVPEGTATVGLLDGSLLVARSFQVRQANAIVELVGGSKLDIPARLVRSACFRKQDAVLQGQWQELLQRELTADLVVIRNVTTGSGPDGGQSAAALDHLPGVLSDITDEIVGFESDGKRIKAQRKKLEGVIYLRPPAQLPAAACKVTDSFGSIHSVRSLNLEADGLHLTTVGGVQYTLPANHWAKVDFASGNVAFLSDLRPELVEWQPYVRSTTVPENLAKWFQPRRNVSIYGGPLMLRGQSYERGLALHSRTLIAFRLSENYQRFLATAGVDDRFRGHGNVHLVVSGENGALFEKKIGGRDEPLELDIDVQGVRRLQILVDFGDDRSDAGDHLNLCNARLTK